MIIFFITVLLATIIGFHASLLMLAGLFLLAVIFLLIARQYLINSLLKISFYLFGILMISLAVFIRHQYALAIVNNPLIIPNQESWAYVLIQKPLVISHSYQNYLAQLLIIHNTSVSIPIKLSQYSPEAIAVWPKKYWLEIKLQSLNSGELTGTILKSAAINHFENSSSFESISQMKSKMIEWIWNTNGESIETSILLAIAMGDRSHLSDNIWLVFNRTGTSHLLAIAGLHLGVIVYLVWFCVRHLWQRSQKAMQALSSQVVSMSIAVICALLYALFTGWAIPCQRAAIMIAVLCLAQIGLLNLSMLDRILLAFSVILFFNPTDIYLQSYWLSFIAVVSICYGMTMRGHMKSWLMKWLYLNLIITFSLLPWSLYFFGQYALLGFIANLIAVPWAAFFILPLAFFSVLIEPFSPLLNIKLWHFCVMSLHPLWSWLQYLSGQPFSYVQMHPPFYVCALYMVGYFWLFAPKAVPGKYWSLLFMLPLFYLVAQPMDYGAVLIKPILIHHEQGLLIRSKDHLWLMLDKPEWLDLNQWDYQSIASLIGSYGSWSHLQGIERRTETLFLDGALITVHNNSKA